MRSTDPPTPELLDQIEIASRNDALMIELGLHASTKLKKAAWRGRVGGSIPGGQDAQEVVQTAFERMLSGSRKWSMTEYPDFKDFALGIIDSVVSALVESPKNYREREVAEFAFEEHEAEAAIFERLSSRVDYFGPTQEEELRNSDFVLAVTEEVGKDDPLLQRVLEAIVLEGLGKRDAIAAHLSVSASDVTNAIKRLGRRLPKLVEQFSHLNPPTKRK